LQEAPRLQDHDAVVHAALAAIAAIELEEVVPVVRDD
jgi:hypothetical protein